MTGTSRQDRREAIARIVYGLTPCMEQQTDGDYRPLGPAFAIPWEDMADYDSGIHKDVLKAADAILALDEPEGLSEAPDGWRILANIAAGWEIIESDGERMTLSGPEEEPGEMIIDTTSRLILSALQSRGSAD